MPDPGVSLIPRGSKSTKKRRTSFRPASKKSSQSKSKTATSSSAKASNLVTPLKNEDSTTSRPDIKDSKFTAEVDSTPLKTTKNSDGDSQSLSSTTKTKPSKPLLMGKNDEEDEIIPESKQTESTINLGLKESTSPRTM